jgi:hypothetical protein
MALGMPGVVFALPVLVAAKVASSHSRRGDVLVLAPTRQVIGRRP